MCQRRDIHCSWRTMEYDQNASTRGKSQGFLSADPRCFEGATPFLSNTLVKSQMNFEVRQLTDCRTDNPHTDFTEDFWSGARKRVITTHTYHGVTNECDKFSSRSLPGYSDHLSHNQASRCKTASLHHSRAGSATSASTTTCLPGCRRPAG